MGHELGRWVIRQHLRKEFHAGPEGEGDSQNKSEHPTDCSRPEQLSGAQDASVP